MKRVSSRRASLFGLAVLLLGAKDAAVALPPAANPPPNETYTKLPDPPVDPAKEKALYTVGYAHLDTQWRWSYPQVVREFVGNTLHDNFKFFEKYPNYVFNFSGSRRYEMMREYYPADYEKLKEYVAAGRWFPCGSSVDEADANVPSLESFVRHVLYGNRYFEHEFGKASQEFMLPDCFGFPASLPSILAHCGIAGFSTQKLSWGSANGIPFKVGEWIGPDGKQITAALDPGAYVGSITEDLTKSESWLTRINKTGEKSGAYVDYHYYGTGDRGGAPSEGSIQWLESALKNNGKAPLRVVSATAERMFNDLTPEQKSKLPTYKGELLLTEHSAGSITSQAYMKRWNRKNELLVDGAERASVAAMLLGAPYPTRKLYEGWDLLLGSQMHDMLPGTSLPKAYEFCWNDELLAANFFAAVQTDAVGAVASLMDTSVPEGSVPLVISNGLSYDRDDLVEACVSLPGGPAKSVRVMNPDGDEVPAQVLGEEKGQTRLLFRAKVPSIGMSVYAVVPGDAAKAKSALQASPEKLENARYRVSIDKNGDIASIFDKANNEELLSAPARLEFHYEKPKQFPAWNMDWSDRQKPASGYVDGPATVRVVENGPVRVAVEIVREARGSRFTQTIRLGDGAVGDRVEVANAIDWQSPECSLKAAFPLKHTNPLASYDDKIGVVTRGNNEAKKYEVPQHQWFDLTGEDGKYGVAVLNDSKFGSDKPDDGTMRLTLLYTPGVRNDFQDQASQDFGHHEIVYAITGHKGDWRAGRVFAQAASLNQPVAAFLAKPHEGRIGKEGSLLSSSAEQVEIAALKKAEASDEVIIRLKELYGTKAGNVEIGGRLPIVSAREVNGQEKPVGNATVEDGKLVTSLDPFGVRAFAVKFAEIPLEVEPIQSRAVTLAYDTDAVSSQKNRADGGFDDEKVTYPAEQFPQTLQSEGVDFKLGATADGQKNAVMCHGQTIDLPEGDYDHVYLLAAAYNGDTDASFKVGGKDVAQRVQDWSGYVGQWDNRQWKGTVPELTYNWHNELDGLVPGYTRRDNVAWYASHRHHPKNGNEFYQYCYLFKYGFELPADTRKLTLPDNPKIGVFAVTVAKNSHEGITVAHPLYDTLENRQGAAKAPAASESADRKDDVNPAGAPIIRFKAADAQKGNDSVLVTIDHPLYWQAGSLHYTLDGSAPTESSPVYSGPFWVSKDTTVTARMLWAANPNAPAAGTRLSINDTTPPKIVAASTLVGSPRVNVSFSEPVGKDAANPAHYQFSPAVAVSSVQLSTDATSATLTLATPLPAQKGAARTLTGSGIRDLSPAGNAMQGMPFEIQATPAAYSLDRFVADGKTSQKTEVDDLPTQSKNPWTINFFVKTDAQPENRTLLAGFGSVDDDKGHGRYLSKFANGIHFWCANQDVETTTPLAIGRWQMLTASFDGRKLTVYQDAKQIGEGNIRLENDPSVVQLAPLDPWDEKQRFAGEIRGFTVWNAALDEQALRSLLAEQP